MKINLRGFLLLLSALIVPLSSATCQEIKTENTIKVILDDGSGAKTVMDTTFTNSTIPDSVILKNGKVIYFAENMKEVKDGKSPEKLIVTVTSTGGDESDKDFDTLEKLEKNDNHAEMTKYVISKDGVVVMVESKDEAKAKDLIKEIENKLGVSKEDSEKKETVKTQTRVTVRK
jgi:hypothetical protein